MDVEFWGHRVRPSLPARDELEYTPPLGITLSMTAFKVVIDYHQSGTKPDLVAKIWPPNLVTICAWLPKLHQPRLWFITGGYLVKRWFLPAAARARGQSNDLNREILASNLFNCRKEVINAPPVPSVSRCIHIVYRHKKIWEYQWSNFIYNCMSTFLHYVRCKDALLDCSAPGGERCESLTGVVEIGRQCFFIVPPLG